MTESEETAGDFQDPDEPPKSKGGRPSNIEVVNVRRAGCVFLDAPRKDAPGQPFRLYPGESISIQPSKVKSLLQKGDLRRKEDCEYDDDGKLIFP